MQEPHLIKHTAKNTGAAIKYAAKNINEEDVSNISLVMSWIGCFAILPILRWRSIINNSYVGIKTSHPDLFIIFAITSIVGLFTSILTEQDK